MKLVVLLAMMPGLVYAQNLRAGVARVDITPPKGQPMAGYPERTRGATGVHDPITATVLVLESDSTSLALVACDLATFDSPRLAALARQKFGIGHTIVSASGTHAGPASNARFTPVAEEKIANAVGEARKSMFSAEILAASGRAYVAFNRRKIQNDGTARPWERNPENLPSHPLDPTVSVIAVRDGEKVRAVLVHFAARVTVLGPGNLEFSADYPGVLRRYVESQTPGALCLFLQGASGDISPNRDREPGQIPAFDAVDHMGRDLGAEVLRALARARPVAGAAQPLHVASEQVEVARPQTGERFPIGITAGVLGAFCFLALPGEPFIEHQITFQARSECPVALLLGSSYSGIGSWAGYMPTIRAMTEGGPGAGKESSVHVGAGEMLVDRGAVALFKLRGLLQELPDPRF
jgi:hypothetical protein